MKRVAIIVLLALVTSACGGGGGDAAGPVAAGSPSATSTPLPTDEPISPAEPSATEDPATTVEPTSQPEVTPDHPGPVAAVMAAALEDLIRNHHTFGQGPPPFSEYLVLDHTDPDAGVDVGEQSAPRPLTAEERTAIEAAIVQFGPVRFVENADEWRTDDLMPVIEGSVIIGIGQPEIDGETALAPVSLWCGGLCGTWFTSTLDVVDGEWLVTGLSGPIAIS